MLHFIFIETDQPPEPVPLTPGCMPVIFVGIGDVPKNPAPSAGRYANPRAKDPCPQISWPKLSNLKKLQKTASQNRQPASYLFFTEHDGGRIDSEWA